MTDTEIIEDATDAQIADWLESHLRQTLAEQDGPIAIALPGGSTPFPILELLAGRDLAFARISAYPTDDRLVPEDHAASNTGKLRALLEPLGVKVVSLVDADHGPPHFALVWLGMGADGHIASLFPNTDPRADDPLLLRRLTPDPLPPEAPFDRITLTMPALLDCNEFLFVMRGAEKRAVFDDALRGASDLPVARLLAARADGPARKVTCFV